jgi:anti-sigma factor RsiW
MNPCTEFHDNSTAWLDGELEKQTFDRLQRHLQGCVACQKEVRLQKNERLWLKRNDTELELRPQLWNQIRRTLVQEAARDDGGFGERLWNLLLPRPWPRFARAWIGVSMVALMATSSILITNSYLTGPAPDQEVRQLMEKYVQWRQSQKLNELPGVNSPATSIDELRMANPFLKEKTDKAESNPFEI